MTIITRRQFAAALGGTPVWPLATAAQQPDTPVVGYLNSRSRGEDLQLLAAFHEGLKDTGYVAGQNVAIEYRFADNQYDRLPTLAADLVRRRVAVIATNGPAVQAAKTVTATVPIIFVAGFDPLEAELVASLNQPGGNITGIAFLDVELGPKRLELLHELVPAARSIAVLINPSDPSRADATMKQLQQAARVLGLQIQVLYANSDHEIEMIFAGWLQLGAGGLVIGGEPFFNSRSQQLGGLSVRHAVPAIYQLREFAAAGGLASYGGSITDAYRLVGVYTGRVLKGERPADLPVQQATKVEMVLNLKTAKGLGLTVPLPLLGRADEVIE
jgi:putative ABC transport system substrate-binding protein